ncbi:hypothetical protein CAPTEDRAFT_212147 [Capitella teleta]|uniref:Flavin-containing monooxygenase n=1 Tax=Capitella teleta TaxID=283909 RepID=R7UJB3_CAPTE|nr:hypothetical protein CAPTEDRAFT_212147 [Capitella teleta]|eukprot:ELU06178.1 hypothetical protein CAPTEDRAFT_212147 [Capitella teleta]
MRVAVIGAGAAGLCALRHLTHQPRIQAVAFEQTKQLGGTWVYTENIGTDDLGLPVHSSMYANLRTNLPKEVMAFPDHPFPTGGSSFISHVDVLDYLKSYSQHFNLEQFIKFSTSVENVEPITREDASTVWKMVSREVVSGKEEHHEFDAVVVCNGHYSVPLIPKIKGLEGFKGQVMHSHNYRHPEDFSGKRVVLLGAASSGIDIGFDLAATAKEIVLCHKKPPLKSLLPSNVRQAPGIKEFTATDIILDNDEIITDVDVMLFCTGYHYTFPFLHPSCHPEIKDERIPLYKHIISPDHPTLSFIGIPKQICPFPEFNCQVQFVLAGLTGRVPIPNRDEMNVDIETDFNERISSGMAVRHAHHMGHRQWQYHQDLARLGQFDDLPLVFERMYFDVHSLRQTDLMTYKKYCFRVTGDESFERS